MVEKSLSISQATREHIVEIAHTAGDILRRMVNAHPDVWEKSPGDLLTDADLAANRYIISELTRAYPSIPVWSEEGTPPEDTNQMLWLVDPLDGTTNFAHRFPSFAVSIGLWAPEGPILGVVHDPMREHTFSALRGHGATLNGTPLNVSQVTHLSRALMACDWARGEARERLLGLLNHIGREAHAVRAIGAAALGISYVAAGWLDGYFNANLHPWDYGAGIVILQEAGGVASTWSGARIALTQTSIICTTPALHPQVLAFSGMFSRGNNVHAQK